MVRILLKFSHRSFDVIRDEPDPRDQHYEASLSLLRKLPASVDLRPQCPPVLDQLGLRSCTAQAIANAHLFDQMKQEARRPRLPSRLFIYWNERKRLGLEDKDSGATLRGGIKVLARKGACTEGRWPYDPAKVLLKPAKRCFDKATSHRALSYRRLPLRKLKLLQACLAEGWPFVFGFNLFREFDSQAVARSGVVPMPSADDKPVGGHAVLAVGYDSKARRFLVMNSRGPDWGQRGFFTLPFDYVTDTDLTHDAWTVRSVMS
jgi:C1A family cysteine protease